MIFWYLQLNLFHLYVKYFQGLKFTTEPRSSATFLPVAFIWFIRKQVSYFIMTLSLRWQMSEFIVKTCTDRTVDKLQIWRSPLAISVIDYLSLVSYLFSIRKILLIRTTWRVVWTIISSNNCNFSLHLPFKIFLRKIKNLGVGFN